MQHASRTSAERGANDRGAGLVEYALLVALIALVCIGAVRFFGTETGDSFSSTASTISNEVN